MVHWTWQYLLVNIVLAFQNCRADASPLYVMSAPNLLRVGTAENIFVEIQGCEEEQSINVEIKVLNFPTKTKHLATTSVILSKAKHFQAFGQITIPTGDFSKDPKIKQYVALQAKFPEQLLEKVVLVSFKSGHIFIQTDKTIYTPSSRVQYRMFAVNAGMKAVERNAEMEASITTEIVAPGGIIVQSESVSLNSGIYSGSYDLGEIISTGLWKVIAKFLSNPQQSFSAEFEVKEYVLPSFEVKLTYENSFFDVNSQEFPITISAKYLFGEDVDGKAYVVFGVMQQDQKKSFPDSLQTVPIERGEGTAKLKKEHITQTFLDINKLVGSQLYVAASVLTESGSEMVEAELRGIQIVQSPYTIRFKKTPRYFVPGVAIVITIEVLYPDETPAQVPLVVTTENEVSQPFHTSANGLARHSINTMKDSRLLTITVKTNDIRISSERQTSVTMTAFPYNTASNNYMHIGVDVGEVQLGQQLPVSFHVIGERGPRTDITYLILSKGQLVDYGHYELKDQEHLKHLTSITKDMMPTFRIVAYYHTVNNEVVSDSVWLDVKGSCMGSLKLETLGSPPYKPRDAFNLKITGDPGAKVGLVAVDKGVYVLNNKHRLSQKKVWEIVEKHDIGCTSGGGRDGMSVFFDAGLLFESSAPPGTPYRLDFKCPAAPGRRKRASTIMDVTTTLVSQYKDDLQRGCCLDGIRFTPLSYNCERRSEYIIDGPVCVQAFLHCCKQIENLRHENKQETLHLARSEENNNYIHSDEITTRSKFPESWLWSEIQLPDCNQGNCVATSFTKKKNPLPDSITTWHITGISLSRTHGICVADSLDLIVQKKFFIDLRLPYSAVRGEQVEVKAILHNYNPQPITVRVFLIENPELCSTASKHGTYFQEVTVGKQSTRSVPFIIIPMKHGDHNIEVKASAKEIWISDGIIKSLRVVSEGVLTQTSIITTLDPSKKGVGGKQVEILKNAIPLKDLVPNSPTTTQISLTGREQVGPLVENAVSGQSMGQLIKQPTGCGEQNMAKMTLPVIATMYLDKTNQWESVGFHKRDEALQHIKTGCTNQITYRKTEGSFAMWPYSQSSTWLTAYVAKVFAMASNLVEVQTSVICDAIKFLVLETQQPDGMFKEIGHVSQRSMIGDVEGRDSDASMTAFCLIAMQESKTLCSASVSSLTGSITKAVTYLEKRLPSLTYPYAVAMTSYALANENKLNKQILYKFVSDSSHWLAPERHDLTLEATAYALLALVKAKAFEDARPVVRWFNQQRKVGGGYGGTQATIMVYQAIAEYWATAEEPEYNLNVDILMLGRTEKNKLNRKDQFATKTYKFNDINKDVRVTATGQGEATITMVSLYYALPKESEGNCQNFNLTVQLLPVKLDEDDEKIYKLKIEVLYKDKEHDATMTILDIGLLTGFTVDKNDLDLLSKGHARPIAKYEMEKALSERGSIMIYLDKVSHTQPEEISFKVHQTHKVGVTQPATVSVYEYYNRTQCMKFYHPQRRGGELLRLCKNNECTCAEELQYAKKKNITNEERTTKVCESTSISNIEYVYKVRVDEIEYALTTDIYRVHIVRVIKGGSYDEGALGKNRTLLGYSHCRSAIDLKNGQTYLIMGTSKDIFKDEQSQLYHYVLGERTWIEYWPAQAECQIAKHRHTCLGMEDLVTKYELFGCQS